MLNKILQSLLQTLLSRISVGIIFSQPRARYRDLKSPKITYVYRFEFLILIFRIFVEVS